MAVLSIQFKKLRVYKASLEFLAIQRDSFGSQHTAQETNLSKIEEGIIK